MQQVDRLELLQCLEAVSPALDRKATLDQSDCFVFEDDTVRAYNGHVACTVKSPLSSMKVAVQAEPLLNLLGKLSETQVDVEDREGDFLVQGKRRRAGIYKEAEVRLPGPGEVPEQWSELSPQFGEAVDVVRHCVSRDKNKFIITCVHLMPDAVEASDGIQYAKYELETGLQNEYLVKPDSLKHVIELGMSEAAETASWIHFRNSAGLTLSCRKYQDRYPDASHLLKNKGKPITLPPGIEETLDKMKVFYKDNPEMPYVEVEIKKSRLKVRTQGASGWYEELKEIKSKEEVSFCINPELLSIIVEKNTECQLVDNRLLLVDNGAYKYVTALISEQ